MINFTELKSFPADIRRFYESFIRDGERIESSTMEELVRDGYVRLFVSKRDDGRFVMANFIAVAPMYASKIMLQSYMIIDENKIDFEGQAQHMRTMMAKLNSEYPGARLLFEAYNLGEFQGMLKHEKPRCIWSNYKMPNLDTGKFLDAELWAYPLGLDDNGPIDTQQIAEWVYVLQRVCYEATVQAAAKVVTACGLPSDRIAFFERAVNNKN